MKDAGRVGSVSQSRWADERLEVVGITKLNKINMIIGLIVDVKEPVNQSGRSVGNAGSRWRLVQSDGNPVN